MTTLLRYLNKCFRLHHPSPAALFANEGCAVILPLPHVPPPVRPSARPPARLPSAMAPATALVTVGSTSFDALVAAAVTPPVVVALTARGIGRLLIQYGRGAAPPALPLPSPPPPSAPSPGAAPSPPLPPLEVVAFAFKPSLASDMAAASLVVTHGGAGSVLEALRSGVPTVVVVNGGLMDNHQTELATALAEGGHAATAAPTAEALAAVVGGWAWEKRAPLPPPRGGVFGGVLAQELVVAYDPWG